MNVSVNRNVNCVILFEGYRHWTFHLAPSHRGIFTKATESRGLASALLLSAHASCCDRRITIFCCQTSKLQRTAFTNLAG